MANESFLTQEIISDSGKTAIVKITERFAAANDRFFTIVVPNNLRFANTSQNCAVSIEQIQYSTSFASGLLKLYWDSSTAPTDIVCIGKAQSGHFDAYMPNSSPDPDSLKCNITLQVYNMLYVF